MTENELSGIILDAALKIHRITGPGLLESVYEELLSYELSEKLGLKIERQKAIPLVYESIHMPIGFRADIVVENKVIVELKSVDMLQDVHYKQLLTYLKLSGLKLGLLINFNEKLLREGFRRVVNGL